MKTKELRKYKVCIMEHLNNSVNGNPRYSMILQDVNTGEYVKATTATDSSYGYYITNSDYKDYFMASLRYTKSGNAVIEKLGKVGE